MKNATNRDAESVAYWQREMQYGIEPEFGDMTLADSSDVQYSSRTKKNAARVFFRENVFPPYDESQSDSHEVAERWARSKDGKEEGERLLSHHGRWYVIKAFDDMKYGYQIIEQVSNAEYNRREKQYDKPGRYDSIRRALDKSASYAGRGTPTHKTGSGFDSLSVEYGKEDTAVSRLDQKQVRWGNATLEQASTDRGSGPDRQRRNGPSVKSQIKQLRNEIRDLEDQKDVAYDKNEKRSIQQKIDEREHQIRQLKAENENQPQHSDRIEEESSVPTDITEEMRQRGEKAVESATTQREAKVAAEQKTHRAVRAALTNRNLIAQIEGRTEVKAEVL